MLTFVRGVVVFVVLVPGVLVRGQEEQSQAQIAEVRAQAEEGLADAQFSLGLKYEKGEGVPKDDIEAAHWYRLAAEQGHARAQYYLGEAYAYGDGVPRDAIEAASWYRLSAEQGDFFSQYKLAIRFAVGEGVTKDDVRAQMWYILASSRATVDQEALANIRDRHASEITSVQLAEAQSLAREWESGGPFSTIVMKGEVISKQNFDEFRDAIKRDSLQGIGSIIVAVEDLHPYATTVGLTSADLDTAIELQLQNNGIPLAGASQRILYVNVQVIPSGSIVIYSVSVSLSQTVRLLSNQALSPGKTWDRHATGYAARAGAGQAIHSVISEFVEIFSSDYLAANPQ